MSPQAVLVLRVAVIFVHLASGGADRLIPFLWDSNSYENGLTYYLDYCDNSKGTVPEKVCFPCSEAQFCRLYGTCCYDWEKRYVHEMFNRAMNSFLERNSSENIALQQNGPDFSSFKCQSFGSVSRLMIDTCSSEETNETSKALCEDTDTVIGYTPFTHAETGLTFRNSHCARCNGYGPLMDQDCNNVDSPENVLNSHKKSTMKSSFVSWDLKIICNHYQFMYTITSEDEFLNAAKTSSLCDVNLNLPSHAEMPESCDPYWYNAPTFQGTSCTNSDQLTLHLCVTLTAPFFRTAYSGRNLFCELCEGVTPAKITLASTTGSISTTPLLTTTTPSFATTRAFTTTGPGIPPGKNDLPPFTLLLGVRSSHSLPLDDLKQCSNITWLNEQGDCQPAICTPGKVLSSAGHCVSALDQVKSLGYKLRVKLTPVLENVTLKMWEIDTLVEGFWERFQDIVVDSNFEFIVEYIDQKDKGLDYLLRSVILDCSLIGLDTLTRDEFETKALDIIHGRWEVPLDANQNVTFSSTRLLSASSEQEKVPEVSKMTPALRSEIIRIPKRMGLLIWQAEDIFIDLSPTLICPYVEVNLTSNATDKEILMFRYRNREIAVKNYAHLSLHDEKQLHICTKRFQRLTRQRRRFKDPDPLILVQRYLEISCIAVSVACLVAAVLTYALFPQLRSLPGLNNMSLCGSLAAAQTSLILTVQSDIVRAFSGPYCLVHAIVLHYSWLASFFWMSVCCVHMFRVFTSSSTKFTNSTTSSLRKRYCHYCVYAFGCPVLIVVLTSVITWALTDGKSMGYNDSTCFLDIQTSYLIIILSLFVPLCCMLVTNSILFILTVRTIVGVTRLQSASKLRERQGIMAYVKLSTLTGAFFIVAVVSVQLQQPLVSIFTSPFAALQGLFIFISFMANRYVVSLYRQKLGLKSSWTSEETPGSNGKHRTTLTDLSKETKAANIEA